MGEQRFKVGDWVRRVQPSDWPEQYGAVGCIYKVLKVGRYGIAVTAGAGDADATSFEPWQPRVGERVRYRDTKYGKAVVKEVLTSGQFLVDTEGVYGVCTELLKSLEPILSTETPAKSATIKIEAGKSYKTRDGRKVGPIRLKATHGSDGPYRIDGLWNYLENGLVGSISNGDHKDDLIAEWIDEPVAKPSATTASNDNAQPKFKVGDRVDVTGNRPYLISKIGQSGIVEIVHGVGEYTVKLDNSGSFSFIDAELTLAATPATTPTSIVALIESGQPKPSSTPHVHTSTGAAEKEAKRLAAKYKGQQFGVFTLTTTHEEAAPVYDHKWQNMAALGLKIDAIKELRAVAGLTLKGAKDAVEAWIEYENAA